MAAKAVGVRVSSSAPRRDRQSSSYLTRGTIAGAPSVLPTSVLTAPSHCSPECICGQFLCALEKNGSTRDESLRDYTAATDPETAFRSLWSKSPGTKSRRMASLIMRGKESDNTEQITVKYRTQEKHKMNRIKGLAAILGVAVVMAVAAACGNEAEPTPVPPAIGSMVPNLELTFEGVAYTGVEVLGAASLNGPVVCCGTPIKMDDMELLGTGSWYNGVDHTAQIYRPKAGGTTDVYTFHPAQTVRGVEGAPPEDETNTTPATWTRWTAGSETGSAREPGSAGQPSVHGQMLVRPKSVAELVLRADAIVIGTIDSVLGEKRIAPYSSSAPLEETDAFPVTDYQLRIEAALKGDEGTDRVQTLVLRQFGHLSAERYRRGFSDTVPLPRPGDHRLFVLGRDSVGTYGAMHIIDTDGETVAHVDGEPFPGDLSPGQFLADIRDEVERQRGRLNPPSVRSST